MKKDTTNDMTVGSPVSLIIKFMIPMCLGNLFQQFYNIADSIVAGKFIGVNALAAIGSTGSLMFFVTGWLNGLSSGFAILVAQWFGAKKLCCHVHLPYGCIFHCHDHRIQSCEQTNPASDEFAGRGIW